MPNRSDERQRGERALRRSGLNSSKIEELRDELQRIDTSGQFTSGLRSARPSTGGVANSRYYETDTRWLYLWNGVAWSNISGIFVGSDSDRTAISISATDNGALALTHTSNIYKLYRVESGSWVEKILDVDDEQAQDIVAALLVDGDVNFTYNDPGASITNVVEKVQGIPYSTVDPTNGQVFQYNSTSGLMEPVDPSSLGGSYTDEMAQDAVGAMVDSTLVYTDATPLLSRAALTGDVTAAAGSNATTLANSGASAGTYTNATVTVDAKGRVTSISSGSDPVAPPTAAEFYEAFRIARGGVTTTDSSGFGTAITQGSASVNNETEGHFVSYTTNTSSGSVGGNNGDANYSACKTAYNPTLIVRFKTGGDITSVRLWAGLFSNDPSASATPSLHIAGLRYDTGVDGTAFFRAITDNGSGSPTATTTTAAIAADTAYTLKIVVTGGGTSIAFYLSTDNGATYTLIATHTTTLPTTTQSMGPALYQTNLAASARTIKFNRFRVRY